MLGHCCDLGYDCAASPFHAEDLRELFEILRAGFSDAEHSVSKPGHAQTAKLLIEELDAQLRCQKRYVLDDGQPDAPLFVLGQLHDGG